MAPEKAGAKQNVGDFQRPDAMGRFGKYGGKYVPETLMYALSDLEKTYQEVTADPAFQVGGAFSIIPCPKAVDHYHQHCFCFETLHRHYIMLRTGWTISLQAKCLNCRSTKKCDVNIV